MKETRITHSAELVNFEPNFEEDISKIPQTSQELWKMYDRSMSLAKLETDQNKKDAIISAAWYFKIYARLKDLQAESARVEEKRGKVLGVSNEPRKHDEVLKSVDQFGAGYHQIEKFKAQLNTNAGISEFRRDLRSENITELNSDSEMAWVFMERLAEELPKDSEGRASLLRAVEYLKVSGSLNKQKKFYKKQKKLLL